MTNTLTSLLARSSELSQQLGAKLQAAAPGDAVISTEPTAEPTAESVPEGEIDWTKFKPSTEGLDKLTVAETIANILLYVGAIGAFIAFILALIGMGIGHKIGGRHVLDESKTLLLRAGVVGIAISSIGGIWSWIIGQ